MGIVCACLPTLRPLFGCCYRDRSRTKESKSSIVMESLKAKGGMHSDAMDRSSRWRDDDGSTIGFARLQDEEAVMSPIEMQRSVYGPVGVAISSNAEKNNAMVFPQGIMKEQTIDQRSEIIE